MKCAEERRTAEMKEAGKVDFTSLESLAVLAFDQYAVHGDVMRGAQEYSKEKELTPEIRNKIEKLIRIAEEGREEIRMDFPEITQHYLYGKR